MTTTLTQSAAAAFDDRPKSGGFGLAVTCDLGGDGASLSLALGQTHVAAHTRLMIAPHTLQGGRIVLARALDETGAETWRITLDADTRLIAAALATSDELQTTLPAGLNWYCLELGIAPDGASLWLNGRNAAQVGGDMSSLITRTIEVGAVLKDTTTSGELHLNELVIADGYIGPVVVDPTTDHADDPTRWLVIYNAADPDSIAWGQGYHDARAVPYANLLGLDLPTDETITEAQFLDLRQAVADYLVVHAMADRVIGIVCGYGVPGYFTRYDQSESIALHLQSDSASPGPIANPLAAGVARPTGAALAGARITARIDGPSVSDAVAMTSRSLDITTNGLGDGDEATLWFDPVTTGQIGEPEMQEMIAWAASVDRQLLRLPHQQTQPPEPLADVSFDAIDRDGFFWGWRQDAPPIGFFAEPAGRRIFCVQLTQASPTAPTLRHAQDGSWAIAALAAGYAATAGATTAFSDSARPDAGRFFAALRQGWTLAEAWFVASPILREGLTLIGDPFMTVPLPRAGWNVYGPFASWADARCTAPIAALRECETACTIDADHQLNEGEIGIYIVRRVDALGREERGASHVMVQMADGLLRTVPPAPALPAAPGWTAEKDGDAWRMTFRWERSAAELEIASLELHAQVQGDPWQTAAEQPADPQSSHATFVHEPSAEPVRYRLRIVGQSGATIDTPWSSWLVRHQVQPRSLQLAAPPAMETSQ